MIHLDRDFAHEIAPIIKEAGKIVLSYFHTNLARTEKIEGGIDHGFVTQADLASEHYLIEQLKKSIPGAAIIAEESGKKAAQGSDYAWVIDPLDGTTNFAHGLPYFCISVGLTYKDQPVFGMIYQPITDELFYATEGKGAYLNGSLMRISSAPMEQSVIAIGLPYAKDQIYANLLESTYAIGSHAYAIRSFGAVALDIAYVSAGRLEGAIFEELGWWDVAAGMVLVTEAGGQVSDFQGKLVTPDYQSFIATGTLEVRERLLSLIKTS